MAEFFSAAYSRALIAARGCFGFGIPGCQINEANAGSLPSLKIALNRCSPFSE